MNQQYIVSPICARVIELLTRTPVSISFKCYGSIRNAKNGVVPMPEDGEEIISHHAVSVIGYSLQNRQFKFKDVDDRLGGNGFGYLPFDYFTDGHVIEMLVLSVTER